jgi:HD-GYP domain-containing protein (c-di-GMP phosphodiesterase class II)
MVAPFEHVLPSATKTPIGNADRVAAPPRNEADSADLLRKCQPLKKALSEAFGNECDLVARYEFGWRWIRESRAAVPTLDHAPNELAEILEKQLGEEKAASVIQTLGTRLVVVRLPDCGNMPCAVVASVPEFESSLLERLVSVVVKNGAERNGPELTDAQATSFMLQVTADFEELTWLRGLATYIELCEIHNSIADVAAATLPSLCELISAEAVALFPLAFDTIAESKAAVYAVGDFAVPQAACRYVIERYGPAATPNPVVRNLGFGDGVGENCNGIRNLILTRVGRDEHQFGWLLAVNKKPADSRGLESTFGDARGYSDSEFGTFEAGMVAAAAVLLGGHARNLAMFQEQKDLFLGMVKALVNSIDAKDTYTCGHSERVAQMACRLGQHLQHTEEECEQLYMTGLLHDIGKIGVPDNVLLKPGKLTDEEFALIKKHPEIGYHIVQHLSQLSYALPGILHHHEAYDGRGYPHQLAGEQIPLHGRLLAVVDAYDAMTSSRPYRPGMPTERAEKILRDGAGRQWDPAVVDAFFQALPEMRSICGIIAESGAITPPASSVDANRCATVSLPPPDFGVGAVPSVEGMVPI